MSAKHIQTDKNGNIQKASSNAAFAQVHASCLSFVYL